MILPRISPFDSDVILCQTTTYACFYCPLRCSSLCVLIRGSALFFILRQLHIWQFVSKQDKMNPQGKCSVGSRNSVRRKTSPRMSRSGNTSKNRPSENVAHVAKPSLVDTVNFIFHNNDRVAVNSQAYASSTDSTTHRRFAAIQSRVSFVF